MSLIAWIPQYIESRPFKANRTFFSKKNKSGVKIDYNPNFSVWFRGKIEKYVTLRLRRYPGR